MHYPYEKIRNLRKKGYTYAEINHVLQLNIPRSSLTYICRGVLLPVNYNEKIKRLNQLHLESARIASAEATKTRFKNQYDLARKSAFQQLGTISKKTALMAIAMLYLGEGSKRSGFRGLSLGSSDPLIVNLYIKLLKVVFNIPVEQLKARISYRSDQDMTYLIKLWSASTGIQKNHFYKTAPDPRTIGKPTKRPMYIGVCAIYCPGTEKQLFLQAYAEELFEKLNNDSTPVN